MILCFSILVIINKNFPFIFSPSIWHVHFFYLGPALDWTFHSSGILEKRALYKSPIVIEGSLTLEWLLQGTGTASVPFTDTTCKPSIWATKAWHEFFVYFVCCLKIRLVRFSLVIIGVSPSSSKLHYNQFSLSKWRAFFFNTFYWFNFLPF